MNCNLVAQYYSVLRDFIVITVNPAIVSGVVTTFEGATTLLTFVASGPDSESPTHIS
ncbi:hypothetical protein GH810_14705 [Acetobacterium paludosum]|uniref:Uncharacterized protein n=1 Tax=Acetobacterium paludosum TaxID=52693 RepID=A0A923HWG2_9FIRM|nr:hypothetical protein [Acetobacterium paludosum]MBC3889561.1 hypothetical protein [Acetobacterium paludosum]